MSEYSVVVKAVLLLLILPLTAPSLGQRIARPIMQSSQPLLPAVGVWSPALRTPLINNTSLVPGSSLTVDLNVTGVNSLTSFQGAIQYDPLILNATNLFFDNTIYGPNAPNYAQFASGQVLLQIYSPGPAFTGNGTLVHILFRVMGLGTSALLIDQEGLNPGSIGPPTPHRVIQGNFRNVPLRTVVPDFSASPNPGPMYTSEYMMGKIAVGIILPQGPLLNWTASDINTTLTGITNAMQFWSTRDPRAHLQFSYDIHIRVPSALEPINQPEFQEQVWINPVMTSLGYNQPDAFSKVRTYDDDIRAKLGTDWAFTIFALESTGQGEFPEGGYGHAYLGGPWETFSRSATVAFNGGSYFEAVPAHETGHIFHATDEYDTLKEWSGYLNAPDSDLSPGIMNENSLYVSPSTALQIGWADFNGNGKLDILNTRPAVKINNPAFIINQTSFTVNGTAVDVPYPRTLQFQGPDISINKIASVNYSLDGSSWLSSQPYDGAFDNGLERFSISLTQLTAGSHSLTINATNTAGNSAITTLGFNVNLPTGQVRVSFVKWGAQPAYHHLDLSETVGQTFFFLVESQGTSTAYLSFRLNITSDNRSLQLTGPVLQIGANRTMMFNITWVPPDRTLRYTVNATLYYSNNPQGTWTFGGAKNFIFTVASTERSQGGSGFKVV